MKSIKYFLVIFFSALVASCGGGGGSSNPVPTQSGVSIKGIVASGNAAVGVPVTLIDANGMTVTITATSATGSYVFPPANYTFPVVVTANTPGGLLVSVLAPSTLPASGSSLNVNVTTLTTAVASLLTNGQPNNTALLQKVTPANVAAAITTLDGILSNVLVANGVNSSLNPITDPLVPNGTGQDAVINAVTIVPGASGPTLTLAANAPNQTPTAGIVLNSSTLASPPSPMPTLPASSTPPSTSANYLDYVQTALQDCSALPVAQRTTSTRCADIVDSAFLQNGYNNLSAAFSDMASPLSISATFSLPKTLFFLTNNGLNYSVVRIYYTLNDGTQSSFTTVAQQLASSRTLSNGTVVNWDLIGNQQIYDASVNSRLQRNIAVDVSAGDVSAYLSGIVFDFNPNGPNAANVNSVNITGPGLPTAGVWLRRTVACNGGTSMALMGTLPSIAPKSTTPINSNTAFYRMDWSAIQNGATVTPGGNGVWAAAPVAMTSLPLYAAYVFTPYDATGKALASFTKYNLAPPTPAVAGASMSWNNLDSSFITNFLNPAGSQNAAQTTAAVSWALNSSAAAPQTVYVGASQTGATTFTATNGSVHVAPTATSATVSPAVTCPAFTPLQSTGDSRFVQLRLRDSNGLQVVDQTYYNVVNTVAAIQASINARNALYATSLPSATDPNVLALFTSTSFLNDGLALSAFMAQYNSDPRLIGSNYSNLVVDSLDTTGNIAQVHFTPVDTASVIIYPSEAGGVVHWQMKKNASGVWQFDGDQRLAFVGVRTFAIQSNCNPQTLPACTAATAYKTGLWLGVIDNNSTLANATVVVTGPGLPSAGVTLIPPAIAAKGFILSTANSNCVVGCSGTNVWFLSDADISGTTTGISAVTASSVYTIKLYNNVSSLLATYTEVISVAPVLNTALAALAYPSITTTSPSLVNLAGIGAVTLTPSWTIPAGLAGGGIEVDLYQTGTNQGGRVTADTLTSSGTASISIPLPTNGLTWTSGNYLIYEWDQNSGMLATSYQ